ncbi:MAG: hypothetical protein M1826_006030 [Phylliscum demangeonii]|nr:MAG: hypothetical protein M1826_006030 [Phylliscum demangeonii]
MDTALKTFFSASHFAVVGASQDASKYGHKVLEWYLEHSLPVTPVNPRTPTIHVGQRSCLSVANVSVLSSPAETSLSIVTPPAVTMKVLEEAKRAGIRAVWLQPGSFDVDGLDYAKKEFPAAIGAYEYDHEGDGEGWCILIDGEDGLAAAGRDWKGARL